MAQLRICGEALQRRRCRIGILRRDDEPFRRRGADLRSADSVREHERQPRAAASLTTTPHGLVQREQREDVGADVRLGKRFLGQVTGKASVTPRLSASSVSCSGRGRCRRRRREAAGRRSPPTARTSVPSPFSGTSLATLRTTTSSGPNPARPQLVAFLLQLAARAHPHASTSTVFAKIRTLPARAPRATTDSRAARPDNEHVGSLAHDPRHDRALHCATPPRARAEVVALDEQDIRHPVRARPRDRRLRRERAPAGDDDDVGIARAQRSSDSRRHRVVVAKQAVDAREAPSPQRNSARCSGSTVHVRFATVSAA